MSGRSGDDTGEGSRRGVTRRRALSALAGGRTAAAVGGGLAATVGGTLAGTASGQSTDATVGGGGDLTEPIRSAIDGLTSGRTSKERVLVTGSGTISGRIDLPSYTVLEFQGTVTADGVTPVYADGAQSIEVRNLALEGSPSMGMRIRRSDDVVLDGITMDVDSGIGIRIDNGWNDGSPRTTTNVRIGSVEITGAGSHGVETYGVDGFEAGTVRTTDTGGCGLLLNDTADATVGHVDATRADPGGGYAGFRCANDAGPGITVDRVDAVGCGRGLFTVSGSQGITIGEVHLADNGGNLIQDTRDLTIEGGTVTGTGGSGFRIDSRSSGSHPHTRDVTIENCRIADNGGYGVRETGPDTGNNAIRNNAFCNNASGAVATFADSTTVSGNSDDCSGGTPTPCSPTAITPYLRIDGGEWQNDASATVQAGTTVEFGPQPTEGGSWRWTGPGLSASTREVTVSPAETATYAATYTNDCGATATREFTVTVEATETGPPPRVAGVRPQDPDSDGVYEDLNGNGRVDTDDVVVYFDHYDDPVMADDAAFFDLNGNDRTDADDVVALFESI